MTTDKPKESKLYPKLLKVQQSIGKVSKDSKNPFFNSKYFDINKLIEVLKPELSKHGLVVLQPLSSVGGKPAIQTVLIDSESGEVVQNTMVMPELDDPQKMGSTITYYRRYALQSFFLLEAEDDDGNKAVSGPAPKKEYKKDSQPGKIMHEDDDWTYATGISSKTNKPYYCKKNKKTSEIVWLRDHEWDQIVMVAETIDGKPVEDLPF